MKIREVDHAVLAAIQEMGGDTDTHQLKHILTLNNRQIDYSIKEHLQSAGYVTIQKQDGFTTCTDHNQVRRFPAPNLVTITEEGRQALAQMKDPETQYEDLDREELVQRIHELENRVECLENGFRSFKKQVKKQLTG